MRHAELVSASSNNKTLKQVQGDVSIKKKTPAPWTEEGVSFKHSRRPVNFFYCVISFICYFYYGLFSAKKALLSALPRLSKNNHIKIQEKKPCRTGRAF
jgi:hypothetical protein